MNKMEEIWKDVIGYEGDYQISNMGNVKSIKFGKERLLKQADIGNGYNCVRLYKNNVGKTRRVHHLVVESFLDYSVDKTRKLVIDHINDNKLDNRLNNLQIITQRENTYKTQGKYSSKYKGVTFHTKNKKWVSQINIDKEKHYLGSFDDEYEAHLAYQNKLNEITKGL